MKRLFFKESKNEVYKNEDYLTLFTTRFNSVKERGGGRVEDIGVRNAVLFADCDIGSAIHEALHGLGLYHTHRDDDFVHNVKIKYIYKREATTNVMSYSSNKNTLWRWQWHMINSNISEK